MNHQNNETIQRQLKNGAVNFSNLSEYGLSVLLKSILLKPNHFIENLPVIHNSPKEKVYTQRYHSLDEALDSSPVISDAHVIASLGHAGQYRGTGESYMDGHIVPVAKMVIKYSYLIPPSQQEATIAAAIIHDVPEDVELSEINSILRLIYDYSSKENNYHLSDNSPNPANSLIQYFWDVHKSPTGHIASHLNKKLYGDSYVKEVAKKDKRVALILLVDRFLNLATLKGIHDLDRRELFVESSDGMDTIAKVHGFAQLRELLINSQSNYYFTQIS